MVRNRRVRNHMEDKVSSLKLAGKQNVKYRKSNQHEQAPFRYFSQLLRERHYCQVGHRASKEQKSEQKQLK